MKVAVLLGSLLGCASARVMDPWGVYCGRTDCYEILGVGRTANETEIKKSYRKLARTWHPDKNAEPDSKAKFEAIAKAYQVLSSEETKEKYDRYLKDPSEYYSQYGQHFMKVVAPKSNLWFVIIFLIGVASLAHYGVLMNKYKESMKQLVKAIVEDWGPMQGGSQVILDWHKKAKAIYDKQPKDKKQPTGSYKKDPLFKELIEALVEEEAAEADATFRKPEYTDVCGALLLQVPTRFAKGVLFQLSWFLKHTIQKQPYTTEEKEYLIERGLGTDLWLSLHDSERRDLLAKDAWQPEKLAEWKKKKGYDGSKKSKKRR